MRLDPLPKHKYSDIELERIRKIRDLIRDDIKPL